jgi:hypothetical protein
VCGSVADASRLQRPNPRMQPTGRNWSRARARVQRPLRTLRNEGLRGREHDGPQLMRILLGGDRPSSLTERGRQNVTMALYDP